MFESNEHIKSTDVDEIIELYSSICYKLEDYGYNTILLL